MPESPPVVRQSLRRDLQSAELVLAGNFNPAILRPAWLARNGLIPAEEAEAAEVTLLRPEFSGFSIGWAAFEVRFDRFSVSSADESQWVMLRDLLVGIFRLLDQTPVQAMGFNLSAHCQFGDASAGPLLSSRLAAVPAVWSTRLEQPRLRQQKIAGRRPGGGGIEYSVEVQPSHALDRALFFRAHEHYENPVEDVAILLDALELEWDDFVNYSLKTFDLIAHDWIAEAS